MREERMTDCLTISVPEAGRRYFGLSRNGSYEAAKRGEIPTIKIGRKLRVPIAALQRMLGETNGEASEHEIPVQQQPDGSLRKRKLAPKTPRNIESLLRESRPIYEQSRGFVAAHFEPKHSLRGTR